MILIKIKSVSDTIRCSTRTSYGYTKTTTWSVTKCHLLLFGRKYIPAVNAECKIIRTVLPDVKRPTNYRAPIFLGTQQDLLLLFPEVVDVSRRCKSPNERPADRIAGQLSRRLDVTEAPNGEPLTWLEGRTEARWWNSAPIRTARPSRYPNGCK